jgi:hypothetical protein
MSPVFFCLALACALAASACSGASSSNSADGAAANASATPDASLPVPAPAETVASIAGVRRPGPVNACDIPRGWFFKGSCSLQLVASDGATFALLPYRDISVTVKFGLNDAVGRVPFIIGDATGYGDVGGLLNGSIPFSGYGTCLKADRTAAPCIGKALIYFIVANGGRVRVVLNATPEIDVASVHGFPGKQCALATMISADAHGTAWVVPPDFAIRTVNLLRFSSKPTPQTYPSGGSFTVFAVVCR